MLLSYLEKIPDPRRGQGRMFDLAHLLLFSILAIASGADSYRKIHIFIKENFETLCNFFGIEWKRPPSYNCIRRAIQSLEPKALEKVFREYSKEAAKLEKGKWKVVSLDGKALKHSFDNIADQRFKQMLSAFSPDCNIILAHEKIGVSKEKETDAAIKLIKSMKLEHVVYTLDALHTQKKR
jgi:hypothetical protein